MKIDTHCHLFSPGLARALAEGTRYRARVDERRGTMTTFLGANVPLRTEEERIAEMDQLGIDMQAVSVRIAALFEWGELSASHQDRLQLCRATNDYLASICRRYPNRFMAYADISLALGEAAIEEMVRCLDKLKLHGVSLLTNYAGKYLDAPEFRPFFEEANRRRVVIFMHPTHPVGREGLMDRYAMYGLVGFPYDTTLTVARMAHAGLFEQLPDFTLILPHTGGTIPFLWWRLDWGYREGWGDARENIKAPPTDYLKRLYYDTAINDTDSLMLAYKRVGDRMMFGTDHPYSTGGIQRTVAAIEAMDVPAEAKAKILGGNALALLRRR